MTSPRRCCPSFLSMETFPLSYDNWICMDSIRRGRVRLYWLWIYVQIRIGANLDILCLKGVTSSYFPWSRERIALQKWNRRSVSVVGSHHCFWEGSFQRSGPFAQCECEEESNWPWHLSSRANSSQEADIEHGVAVQQRSEGKPISMEDFHEQQEAAGRNEAADGAYLQVHQQVDHEQSHSGQFWRSQSICSLSFPLWWS